MDDSEIRDALQRIETKLVWTGLVAVVTPGAPPMRFLSFLLPLFFASTGLAQLPAGAQLRFRGDTGVRTAAGALATTDGQAVESWDDQSGNAYHLTQITGANQPVFQDASTITGQTLPGVRFEMVHGAAAANRPFMNFPAGPTWNRQASTVFIVAQTTYHNQASQALIAPGNSGLYGTLYWDTPVNASGTAFGQTKTATAVATFPGRAFIGNQKAVYGYRATTAVGGGIRHYRNTDYFDSSALTAGSIADGGYLMKYTATSWHCAGVVYEIVQYNSALSDADVALAIDYLMTTHSIPDTTGVIVCEGDSIMAGHSIGSNTVFAAKNRFVPNYLANSNPSFEVYNTAIASSGSDEVVARFTNHTSLRFKPGALNIYCLHVGTNDISLDLESAATVLADVRALCLIAKASGWKVIVSTVIARNDPAYDGIRAAYNVLLRAAWPEFADALADPGADPLLSDETNTTYFNTDAIHLNAAGCGVLASHFNEAIAEVEADYYRSIRPLRRRGR